MLTLHVPKWLETLPMLWPALNIKVTGKELLNYYTFVHQHNGLLVKRKFKDLVIFHFLAQRLLSNITNIVLLQLLQATTIHYICMGLSDLPKQMKEVIVGCMTTFKVSKEHRMGKWQTSSCSLHTHNFAATKCAGDVEFTIHLFKAQLDIAYSCILNDWIYCLYWYLHGKCEKPNICIYSYHSMAIVSKNPKQVPRIQSKYKIWLITQSKCILNDFLH